MDGGAGQGWAEACGLGGSREKGRVWEREGARALRPPDAPKQEAKKEVGATRRTQWVKKEGSTLDAEVRAAEGGRPMPSPTRPASAPHTLTGLQSPSLSTQNALVLLSGWGAPTSRALVEAQLAAPP